MFIGSFRPDNSYVTAHRLLFGSFKTVQYADSLNRIFSQLIHFVFS